MTLLNSWEVHKFAPIAGSFGGEDFKHYMAVEPTIFEGLEELYTDMLADLKAFNATRWQTGTYPAGSVVLYDGEYWTNETETEGRPPCDWIPFCRFESECFCDLWKFVAPWIAVNIVKLAIPTIHSKVSPEGVVINQGADYIPVDKPNDLRLHFDNLAGLYMKSIKRHIENTPCLEKYKEDECEVKCKVEPFCIPLIKRYGNENTW